MEIVYTAHAVNRMQSRNITAQDLERVVDSADGRIAQSMDKTIFFKKLPARHDNLIAAVTVMHSDNLLEVITVMNHFEVKT